MGNGGNLTKMWRDLCQACYTREGQSKNKGNRTQKKVLLVMTQYPPARTGWENDISFKNVYYSGKVSELDMSESIAPFTELAQEAIIFDGKSTMVNCFTRMILPTW